MRLRDILLIVTALAGIALGVLLPDAGLVVKPAVLYMMMTILFMSFLKIDLAALTKFGPGDAAAVAAWTVIKLVALPVVLWGAAALLMPSQALGVLLLSSTSTGVTAPFFAVLLGANTARVLQVVVATSLLVPLTVPALVKLLMGAEISIGFYPMARMLVLIILAPFALSLLVRRLAPAVADFINRVQFPVSLALFFLINWGVFAGYSAFLIDHRWDLAASVIAASVLAVLYAACGFAAGRLPKLGGDGLTGSVMMTFVNNVLVIVFASQFFGAQFPEAPLLAAMYLVPFFFIVIPLRWIAQRQQQEGA